MNEGTPAPNPLAKLVTSAKPVSPATFPTSRVAVIDQEPFQRGCSVRSERSHIVGFQLKSAQDALAGSPSDAQRYIQGTWGDL